jgi:branched-subunit amino acid ABC-type transport system permease component
VLRPLVNRPPIALFMATLGLSLILEGAAQLFWGAQVHGLDLGIDDRLCIWRCDGASSTCSRRRRGVLVLGAVAVREMVAASAVLARWPTIRCRAG